MPTVNYRDLGFPNVPAEHVPIPPLSADNPLAMRLPENWNNLSRTDKYDRLEEVVGNTPIHQYAGGHFTWIDTKMELSNPSGSHYDRAFLKTLRSFEEDGFIKPGDELRDITSGSAGISLAMLGWALDYKVRITVPDELPERRLVPMRLFGAKIVKAGPGYIPQASEFQSQEITSLKLNPSWQLTRPVDREQRAFVFSNGDERICYLNHSENLLTPDAFRAIGEEAVSQMVEAPDSVILAMGNWTTIAGISSVIRKAWPHSRIIGYEGEDTTNHDNYGTTVSGIPLRFRDDSLIDAKVVVNNAHRDLFDREINRGPGDRPQLGHSSIMGLVAAQAERDIRPGSTALTIAYDDKRRY